MSGLSLIWGKIAFLEICLVFFTLVVVNLIPNYILYIATSKYSETSGHITYIIYI